MSETPFNRSRPALPEAWVERWLEGTLSASESAQLDEMLAQHPDMGAMLQRLALVDAALRTYPRATPPAQLVARVMADIRTLPPPQPVVSWRRAAAALGALTFGTLLAWMLSAAVSIAALVSLFPALQAPLAFLSTLLGALAHLSTALLTVLTMLLAPFFTLAAVGLAIGIASLWVAWFQRQAQRALSAT